MSKGMACERQVHRLKNSLLVKLIRWSIVACHREARGGVGRLDGGVGWERPNFLVYERFACGDTGTSDFKGYVVTCVNLGNDWQDSSGIWKVGSRVRQ